MIESYQNYHPSTVEGIQYAIDQHNKNLKASKASDAYFALNSIFRILDKECKSDKANDNPINVFKSLIVNKCSFILIN